MLTTKLPSERYVGFIRRFNHDVESFCSSAPFGTHFRHFVGLNAHDHFQTAMHDFIHTFISPDDLKKSILPVAEKALLRSPEYSLNGGRLLSILLCLVLTIL